MVIDRHHERQKLIARAKAQSRKLGRKLALKRIAAGCKAGYVAAKIGLHQSQLSDMEHGKRYWREHHIKAFLKAIGETNNNNKKKGKQTNGKAR